MPRARPSDWMVLALYECAFYDSTNVMRHVTAVVIYTRVLEVLRCSNL